MKFPEGITRPHEYSLIREALRSRTPLATLLRNVRVEASDLRVRQARDRSGTREFLTLLHCPNDFARALQRMSFIFPITCDKADRTGSRFFF